MISTPQKPERCPNCGSGDVRPIAFGLPSEEAAQAARRGEIVLGGCVVTGNDPQWFCSNCEATWRSDPAPEANESGADQ
jgi:hypothetical protein